MYATKTCEKCHFLMRNLSFTWFRFSYHSFNIVLIIPNTTTIKIICSISPSFELI